MSHVFPEQQKLFDTFPCLKVIPDEEWVASKPQFRTLPAKSTLFHHNDADHYSLFLVSGTVLISNLTEGGNETLSIRLTAGDICALMVLSGLSDREYPGSMIAETEVTAVFVSKNSFLHWIQMYPSVRNAIFGNMLDGIIRMGNLLSDKNAQPVDARVAKALLQLTSEQRRTVQITHQQLAFETGSAREVISRILGRMRKNGWIESGRGYITVKQRESLSNILCD